MPILDQIIGSGISPFAASAISGGTATVTAAGTTLATGTLISTGNAYISIVSSSGKSVTLAQCSPGTSYVIYNGGANTANVYPPTAAEIFTNGAAGAKYTLAAQKTATFNKYTATQWGVDITA